MIGQIFLTHFFGVQNVSTLFQLYGFHKTTQDPDVCEFQHKYFRRDKPEVLFL